MDGNVTLGRGQIYPFENYKKGSRIWHRHAELVWIGGELLDDVTFETRIVRLKLDDDSLVDIQLKSLEQLPFLRNPSFLVGQNDLTTLSYLHEPAVLHNLQHRFTKRVIYTYCGIVLVAINPYHNFPEFYSEDVIQVYRVSGMGKSVRDMDPHIFAVAEEAYFDMAEFGRSQSIIVSGESGAGKTMSAKFVMRYLASVASGGRGSSKTGIEQRVLASNPIMESIGNAKTIRNDNSSRFGKFIQIKFRGNGRSIGGAEMKTYLLEKSRLVFQAPGERNYHIFYQLCAARNHPMIESFHMEPCEKYAYLSMGGDSRIPGVDDKADFVELLKAFSLLGFQDAQSVEVFRIIAGVLLLGNINFVDGDASANVSASCGSDIARLCANMWQIDESDLRVWLTQREIRAVNEVVTKGLTRDEATRSRDALAKMVYSHVFSWVVDRVNAALEDTKMHDAKQRIERFIGVLDIYGFETFEVNSFEQFCINYANEKLQQQFNQHVFKLEQEEYIREEIDWVRVDFHDNQPAIDLIEGQIGLISLLDEQCRLVRGSDQDWLSQISGSAELKKNPQLAFPRVRCNDFIVRHFAADVTYTTDGFVEKNRDTISEQLLEVVARTKMSMLKDVLSAQIKTVIDAKAAQNGKRTTKRTVASQFRDSLRDLMTVLCATRPHYVRCIKPNDSKMSFEFDPKRAIQQLRACGVLETVRISAAGFPSRYPYDEFSKRYRVLHTKNGALWKEKPKMFAELACSGCLEDGKYALGKTKIFLRTGQVAKLEKVRVGILTDAAVTIQKTWRGFVARRRFETMRRSLLIVQASLRAFLALRRIKYLQMYRAAIAIQTAVRAHQARKRFMEIRSTVLSIQSRYRAARVRRMFEKMKYEKSAIVIQSAWRGYLVRRAQIERRKKIVMVQCCVRKWLAKRRLRELKIEARSVGHLQKLNTGLENKIIELQMRLDVVTLKSKETQEKLVLAGRDLDKTRAEMAALEAERLTLLEAKHRMEVLQLEVERLETDCDVKEAEKGQLETRMLDLQSRLDVMQSESAKSVKNLEDKLQEETGEKQKLADECKRLTAELTTERTTRSALDGEVLAMREQLMRNVNLFESGAFTRNGSVRKENEPARTSSNLSSLASTSDYGGLFGAARPVGSSDSQLDDVALILRQQNMINDLRQRAEQCQRETARMKAILEASNLVETLDQKTSSKAYEMNKTQMLEGSYNRLKQEMKKLISTKSRSEMERSEMQGLLDHLIEENEQYREELAMTRAMFSNHVERQSVSGHSQHRKSPRPDSGHCSGADSEDGSTADLDDELCTERLYRNLKTVVNDLEKMLTDRNIEIERLEKQRLSESQMNFRPSDCSIDEAVKGMHKNVQLLAAQNMDLNEKLTRQSEELADARAQLRGYGGPAGIESTSDADIIRLESFQNNDIPHSGQLEVFNVPEFSRILVCELKPQLARLLRHNLPAYLVLAAFRVHDASRDDTALTGFFSTFHAMLKDTLARSHDLDHLSLWLANTWRLFNLLRQYSGDDRNPEWQAANTEQQNKWRLKAYDVTPIREQLKLRVEESYANLMKKCIEHVLSPKIVPGILQHESSSDLMTAGQDQRDRNSTRGGETPRKGLDDLLQFMEHIHTKLTTYGADSIVIGQVISQVTNWMCALALNHMMFRKELCNFEKAIQIKHNVTQIQNWLHSKGLGEHRELLEPLVQACHLLQSRKDESNLDTLCGEMTSKLKPRQVVAILQHYDPSDDMEEFITADFLIAVQKRLNERSMKNNEPIEDKNALIMMGTYLPPFDTRPFSYSDFSLESLSLPSCLHLQNVCRLV